jgi:hypothetical protein
MSRFTMTLTAAAVSALVAGATVALPAFGDDPGKSGDDGVAALAACLRSHGLEGAPSTPDALKPWIAQRQAQDPQAVKAAMNACQSLQTVRKKPDGPDVQKLVACLRANGLDAPSDPVALKRWLGQKEADDHDAVDGAMVKCKMQLDPGAAAKPAKPAACGDDAAKPAEPATKPDAAPEPTT